jgi:hypothetical protein
MKKYIGIILFAVFGLQSCANRDGEIIEILQAMQRQNEGLKVQISTLQNSANSALATLNKISLTQIATDKKLEVLQTDLKSVLTQLANISAQMAVANANTADLKVKLDTLQVQCAVLVKKVEALGLPIILSDDDSYLPKQGLQAWYPFDTNYNDLSGNNYNGRVVGNVPFIADRNGKSNSAIQGGSGYITTSKDFFRFSRKDSYSVSVWFTVPSYGCSGRLLSTESSEGHLRIGNSGNGTIVVQFGDYLYPTKTSPNKWHHLVYVYDNRNEVVYIDGFANVTNYEQEMSEVLVYNTPFTIGAKASPAYDLWCGNIDDIGVWNRPLSSQEVLKLFNGNKTL